MKSLSINQEFLNTVETINHNVITFVDVTVNGVRENIQLIFKNNLHTKSGKIIKISDVDTEFQKRKLLNELNFKK
jgi:hypothetical protein